MSRNKKIGIFVWGLGLILSNMLLFCLSRELTPTVWITFGFVWLAFLSALAFQLLCWKQMADSDEQILHISTLVTSYAYMGAQIPLCVVFSVCSVAIPWKTALLIHTVLLILAWLIIIASLTGNDHIRKVNGRQKDHHMRL